EFLTEDDEPGGVRVLTLNRPEMLNAWHEPMRAELRDAIDGAASDRDLRVLVLAGAGRAFSAGEDVSGMEELARIGTRGFRAAARRIHDVFDTIEAMEVPVIAAVGGVAAGGGFELALSCDFRVMSENARLVMPEGRVGLIPGSGGCSRLVRYVGLGRAKELVLLGGSVDAARALELGLALRIAGEGEALPAALELAAQLQRMAPLALGMAKLVLNTCMDVDAETGRRLERLGQSVLKLSEDHREGASAFLDKRPPEWRGR
ncbi:MAG TPA: enoyl-CoA hydratase/isomerase family protein, partial [Acidimicrobiales bacterium]|nr:enoyl-CoA hydratase/isomerase family protein [Acidimicrobiales bacterium]